MPRATELMKVVPTLVVPAAYVGIYREGGDLYARTYTEAGEILAEVGGPWTDPGIIDEGSLPGALFLRGATEGSLAGCSIGFVLDFGTSLHIIDLEGLDIVAPATTHRPAETGGLTWRFDIRAGAAVWYECGVLSGTISGTPGTAQVGWLRSLSPDGLTIQSLASSIPSPFVGYVSGTGAIGAQGVTSASPTTFAIGFYGENDSPNLHQVAVQVVDVDGDYVTVDNRSLDNEAFALVGGGLVIGASIGGHLTRVTLDSVGPFFYDDATSAYVHEDLFNLTDFTPLSSSVNRDGTVLVYQSDGTSKLCTWDGSAPIGDADAEDGPTFAGDWGVTEALVWMFGL